MNLVLFLEWIKYLISPVSLLFFFHLFFEEKIIIQYIHVLFSHIEKQIRPVISKSLLPLHR
jgi:hypothetical protein